MHKRKQCWYPKVYEYHKLHHLEQGKESEVFTLDLTKLHPLPCTHLQCGYSDQEVVMIEEAWEDIKDGCP